MDGRAELAPAQLEAGEWAKYHALGNDYLVMDGCGQAEPDPAWVRALCARHTGVGSDGLLWRVSPKQGAQAGLRIFNPDGSEAEKSGNGLRIFARFLLDFGYLDRASFCIAVGTEVVDCALLGDDGGPAPPSAAPGRRPAAVATVRTSMGKVQFVGAAVGLDDAARDTRKMDLAVGDGQLDVTCVGIGNPHCVVFGVPHDRITLLALGPALERHPAFLRRTNVQLLQVVDRRHLRALIWERGAGETMASGSSSCAVAAAAHERGLTDAEVTVMMPGGEVQVTLVPGGDVQLTGPATPVARGRSFLRTS